MEHGDNLDLGFMDQVTNAEWKGLNQRLADAAVNNRTAKRTLLDIFDRFIHCSDESLVETVNLLLVPIVAFSHILFGLWSESNFLHP